MDRGALRTGLSGEAPRKNNAHFQQYEYNESPPPSAKSTCGERPNRLWSFIRPSFLLDNMDARSLEVVIRSNGVFFIILILLVIPEIRGFVGADGYLALLICSVRVSGGLSAGTGGITCLIDLVFAAMGYTIGIICNAINWKIRGSPSPQILIKTLIEHQVCPLSESPSVLQACFMQNVSSGYFLKTSTTAVSVCILVFYIFIMGLMGSNVRILQFSALLSSGVAMSSVAYLNFIPIFQPEVVAFQIMIPIVVAVIIRAVLCITMTPFTSNSRATHVLSEAISEVADAVQSSFCDDIYKTATTKNLQYSLENIEKKLDSVSYEISFSGFELSYGRYTAQELQILRNKLRSLLHSLWLLSRLIHDPFISSRTAEHEIRTLKPLLSQAVQSLSSSAHFRYHHQLDNSLLSRESKDNVIWSTIIRSFDIVSDLNRFSAGRKLHWIFPSMKFMFSKQKGSSTDNMLTKENYGFHSPLKNGSHYFMFAAKQSIVCVAMLTPYFCRPTFPIAYKYRFVLAPIITVFMIRFRSIDGIYGYLRRVVFVGLGAALACVVWYISRSNAWGFFFAFLTVYSVFIYYRHFARKHYIIPACIMLVTLCACLGTSWADSRIPGNQNPFSIGPGSRAIWVRLVTILVGVTIGFIFNMLPDFDRTNRATRVSIAHIFESLDTLRSEICTAQSDKYQTAKHREDWIGYQNEAIKLFGEIRFAAKITSQLKHEPSVFGSRRKHISYQQLITKLREVSEITLFISYLVELSCAYEQSEILKQLGWKSSELGFNTSAATYLHAQALSLDKPLPQKLGQSLYECHTSHNFKDGVIHTLAQILYRCMDDVALLTREIVGM